MPPARTALGGALVLGLLLLGAQAAVTGPERVVLDFNNAAQESIRSVGVQNQLSAKVRTHPAPILRPPNLARHLPHASL
jgi:hypothetical protein